MDDLIKREDTIDICINAIDLWNGQIGCGALIAVKDKIADLPSAQQWIPVSERLPEKPGRYLCTYDHDGLVCLDIGRFSLFDSNEWLTQPIAWMPLPEPYEAPAPERDCEHCVHHTDKGCSSWDCEYEKRH